MVFCGVRLPTAHESPRDRGEWSAALNLCFVMKVTAKEVLTSQNWIITRIYKGYKGKIRIDAKRRYHVADKPDFFSKWVTLKYANSVRISEGLNKIEL